MESSAACRSEIPGKDFFVGRGSAGRVCKMVCKAAHCMQQFLGSKKPIKVGGSAFQGTFFEDIILEAMLRIEKEQTMAQRVTANDLRRLIEEFVSEYPLQAKVRSWWRSPLLATARADDRFKVLPEIAADDHVLPWQLLQTAKTVIVFFLPFAEALSLENSPGKRPCRNWGLAYQDTNRLIGKISERILRYLAERGYRSALTPATHNFDAVKLMSRWSHKHLAYLSGLGRFGVNAQLITPSGCSGRLGSLVTEADLGDSALVATKELCLHRAGEECLECVRRCPVDAVKQKGIVRERCWGRLNSNLKDWDAFAGLEDTTHVCGKCVVDLPCSLKAPMPIG